MAKGGQADSGSGNEIGPFRAVEESTLAQLTPTPLRSDVFAWYTLLGNLGIACGTIICGWIVQWLTSLRGWTPTKAYRTIFWLYASLGLAKLVLSLMLSGACEPQAEPEKLVMQDQNHDGGSEAEGLLSDDGEEEEDRPKKATREVPPPTKRSIWPKISPASRDILLKLCLLFTIDSFASGLAPFSWMTYFFERKFSLPEGFLGTLFFATNIISSLSTLVASSIAKRMGLVKTMVFTHLPSAIFLSLIPLPSNVGLAITFLVLRSCSQSMDQAPRQAFLAAAVLPNERTAVMGVVNVVRTMSQSPAPFVTGWLAGFNKIWIAFVVAGVMKASYDLSMLKMFLGYKSREEQQGNRGGTRVDA